VVIQYKCLFNQQYPVYYQQQGDQAKIALPIVVVLLAFIEHVILLIELLCSCCCRSSVEQVGLLHREGFVHMMVFTGLIFIENLHRIWYECIKCSFLSKLYTKVHLLSDNIQTLLAM